VKRQEQAGGKHKSLRRCSTIYKEVDGIHHKKVTVNPTGGIISGFFVVDGG
jgi:hypothetical protein